jgi:SAM-dependent methyltransferase
MSSESPIAPTRRGLAEQRVKQFVRRVVGEPYVGKRLKIRAVERALVTLQLSATNILDAGAEDATFVYWLADQFPKATVTATDIDEQAMATCRAACPPSFVGRVSFRVGDFETLPPATFDLVTAFDVLEHITDDHAAIAGLARSLAPGGTLLVHVPRDQWMDARGHVQVVPDSEAWRINSGHVRMGYSEASLRALVEGAGLRVESTELWLRRWGVRAHSVYSRVEPLVPLRLATIPFTDLAARLDRRRPSAEGNTVWLVATKP